MTPVNDGTDRRFRTEVEVEMAASWERRTRNLERREQIADGAFALAFVAAASALPLVFGVQRDVDAAVAAAYTLAFALAGLVRFHSGTGYGTPTQLVFVPMLFALPPEVVPLSVGAGAVLTKMLLVARGRVGPDRWVIGLADSWFAIVPAAVVAAAAPSGLEWGDWPLYAAVFAAQFAGDATVSSLRAWACLGASPLLVAREVVWIYRTDALLTPVGLLAAAVAVQEPLGGLLVLPLVALMAIFAGEREARIENELELQRAYRGTAFLLGDVIEDDDAYTGQHTRGVVDLATAVAGELGLDARLRRECEFGALLHDVGKLRVPKELINKPGPLTLGEWTIMRAHTIEGQRMLERVGGVLSGIGRIVRASHERWDGNGYPDGLAADAIPLAARVVAVCDAYNAMTSDRPYRRALPHDVARQELEACAGTQFDPRIVAALLRVLDRGAAAAEQRPTGGRPALVRR